MTTEETEKRILQALRLGRAAEAEEIAAAALAMHPEAPFLRELRGRALHSQGRHDEAVTVLDALHATLDARGGDREALVRCKHMLGVSLNGLRRFEEAAALLREAIELGGDHDTLWSAASKSFHHLGEAEIARYHGAHALRARDRSADAAAAQHGPVAASRPRPFDPMARRRNVIAYSLFGTERYYRDCAIVNSRIAQAIYPDFTARYYCAEDTPRPVLDELVRNGAEVKLVRNPLAAWEGLFWRFWAFDDPEVDVVLIRDVDSPLTARERVAVEDWLHNSELPFHVLRDHVFHCTPMMAGLWGGFTGLLPPLKALSRAWLERSNSRYADQAFLIEVVWARIRDAALAHDSHYNLRATREFPPWGRVSHGVHAGWSWPWTGKLGRPNA
ncbi:tetratricopeptide repeat protein [Albidovulum sediminis]|uniref:Tetratricopeptide repeat protein n=1 Tax=Albidovulum sediminis TaxID=3066345 RepID=A0ABT2NP96_9RHOB|nr:tetratricopeptide repeat protein [Defluviimonas sediminis]MCT8330760.1 tetratricopeptide repeat protein [Defluviimonas sediminis]